jgi:hypothetical protein
MAPNPYQSPKVPDYKRPASAGAFGGEYLIRNVCIAIAAVVLIDAALGYLVFQSAVSATIRLVFNFVCLFFLFQGANWSRWLFGIGSLFGALYAFVTWFTLDKLHVSMFSLIGLWLLFLGLFDIFVAGALLFTERANKYFGT